MMFRESIAATKRMDLFPSSHRSRSCNIAWRGIVDFKLGVILGLVMFDGGVLGGSIALKMNTAWLRRIFIVAVLALAAGMLYVALSA